MESKEYQKTIEYLCDLIKAGELTIGSKLPTERKLAETLSIGRNSIREALRILESIGMVECKQGSGNYIAGNVSKTISEVIEMMLLLKQITKEEIIVFRRDMEKAICNSIIESKNIEKWYYKIKNILITDIELQSLEEQIEADWNFHYMLILATENQVWISISKAIITIYQNWIGNVLKYAEPDIKQKLQESHIAILSALWKGSRDAVEKAIDFHYDLVDNELKKN